MSLKVFHLLFIVLSLTLSVGLGGWFVFRFAGASGAASDLLYCLLWIACGLTLAVYGRYFLRKLRLLSSE